MEKIDPELKAQWEEILDSYGLSMNAGVYSKKRVSLVGGLNNLVGMEEEEFRKESGQSRPSGHGPDK